MPKDNIIATKFGGTSVRDATRIIHLRDNIVRTNRDRRAIVVSAPAGVTNKLISWAQSLQMGGTRHENKSDLAWVRILFSDMVKELDVSIDVDAIFHEIREQCISMMSRNIEQILPYAVSRGEWLNAQIVARALNFEFVDAFEFIVVDKEGRCKLSATKRLAKEIGLVEKARRGIVVGGFYGRAALEKVRPKSFSGGGIIVGGFHSGEVRPRLFSRGGSDISGAILAVLVKAKVYENWTDVSGVLAADPRIVKNPQSIDRMTFRELRELAFMGAKVFHEDAVRFARNAGIPIHIRSTADPYVQGTTIQEDPPKFANRVTGIAGKNGFTMITVERLGLNEQIGIQSRIERVFTRSDVGVNTTSSIDSVTVIVETKKFQPLRELILERLGRLTFDTIRVQDNIALICTVGERMRSHIGTSATVDVALARSRINIVLELQGGSEINIIRGVKEKDAPRAIRTIYRAFFGKR